MTIYTLFFAAKGAFAVLIVGSAPGLLRFSRYEGNGVRFMVFVKGLTFSENKKRKKSP